MSTLVPLGSTSPNPWNTRLSYDPDAIRELAEDIARNGLLQPPVGRVVDKLGCVIEPSSDPFTPGYLYGRSGGASWVKACLKDGARIQFAFGHSRWHAVNLLFEENRHEDAMEMRLQPLTDEQMADVAWSENEQRKDLTPIEEAEAIHRRMKDFDWTQAQVAEHLGMARSTVANKLRLLGLPDAAKNALAAGTMSERAAMGLLLVCGHGAPLDEAIRTARNWHDEQLFEQLVERAAAGEHSDTIRQQANALLRKATHELDVVDPDEAYELEGARAAMCNVCTLLVKVKDSTGGTVQQCGDAACLALKRQAAATSILAAASEETGLPITAEADTEQISTFRDYGSAKLLANRLVKKGCPSGRLHVGLTSDTGYGVVVEGHPHARLVCVHAKGGRCTCQNPKTQASAAAQETRTGRAKAKLLGEELYVEPARAAVLEALLSQSPAAWNIVLSIVNRGTETGQYRPISGFQEEAGTLTFDSLCGFVTDWVLDVERHFYQYPDALDKVKKFALSRLKPMGLELQEPDFGPLDMDLVGELATVPLGELDDYLQQADTDTLREALCRITDDAGEPTQGNKGRTEMITARLQAIHEARFANLVEDAEPVTA